jgi:regulator of nonsense transcripts 3
MVGQNPQIMIARPQKGNSTNGVLPISASQTNPQAATPKSGPSRSAGPRLKVVIRRLPPGLTQAELDAYLGYDWKVGGGRVDWMIFKPGKVSKEYVASQSALCDLI